MALPFGPEDTIDVSTEGPIESGHGVTDKTKVATATILERMGPGKKREHLASMNWIEEDLVEVLDDGSVMIGNRKFINIDYSNMYNFDRALQAGAVRSDSFNLIRRTIKGTPEEYNDFCERVLGLRKEEVYRTSQTGSRAIPVVIKYTSEHGYIAMPDNTYSTEQLLPAIFIEA